MRVELIIRRAIGSDSAAVTDLYLRARRAGSAAGTIPPLVHDAADVSRWIGRWVIPSLECWVAERVRGGLVGMLVLDQDWLDQLYVDPDLSRNRIGAELLAVAKRERPNGLRLWTFVSNEGAQRFYLGHGFEEVERTDGSGNEERAADIQYAWTPA